MVLVAQRNMVLDDKTHRPGDEIVGLSEEVKERFVRDGLAIFRESPVDFDKKVEEEEVFAELDPERKPSKRKV